MPIDETERKRIVQAIRGFIAKERISRDEFARRAKLGKSTVDKLVVGIFSEKTILQIESQVSIKLMDADAASETAAEELGKYNREDTKNYVGEYVFARPSFHEDGLIHAFHMEIAWDDKEVGLLVRERTGSKKQTPPQFGKVYVPRASRHIFILSNEKGWLKKVILSQIEYRRMKGIMLTMGHAFANVYTPVAMPVIMNKYDQVDDDMIGEIDPRSRMYEEYNQDLLAVEQGQYAKWIRMKQI